MALKLCPNCQKPYLDTEEYCPRCPSPKEENARAVSTLGCVLITVVAIMIMTLFWLFLFLSMFMR
jgi:uncharacterized OB-fold protein